MSSAGIGLHRPKATDYDRDDRATVAVFATVIASVVAAVFHARAGSVDRALHLATLGVSLFISVAPFVAWRVSVRGHYDEPPPWWRSQPTLTILAIAVAAATGVVGTRTALNPLAALAALGFLSAAAAIILWIRQGRLLSSLIFVVGSAVLAVWASGLSLNGAGAQGASLPATSTLFYAPGYSVISTPLFFTAILLPAVELKKSWNAWPGDAERPLRTDYSAWFFVIVVSIGVIPTSGLDAIGIGNRNGMTSGPSATAISLGLMTIATAVTWWRRKTTSPAASDVVFLLLFVPLMLVSIGVVSTHLMLILAAVGASIALLGRMFGERLIGASTLLSIAVAGAAWKLLSIAGWGQVPLDTLPATGGAWWPYFYLVNLFWGWLYIYLRLREERLENVGSLRGAALEGRITDVVIVAIVSVVSITGSLTFELIGSGRTFAASASDFDRWLALSLLMASSWRWLMQWRKQKDDSAPAGGLIGSIRISQLWLVALAIPVGITVLLNVLRTTLALRH